MIKKQIKQLVLTLIVSLCGGQQVYAVNPDNQSLNGAITAEDQRWARDVLGSTQKMTWQQLEQEYEKLLNLEEKGQRTPNSHASPRVSELKVFVSASMPKPLLKEYVKEAGEVGAVLVFKGLPDGSFKQLTQLVTEIEDAAGALGAAIQIDDIAFQEFGIKAVPAFVLTKESCLPYQTCRPAYDIVIGNLGIKVALGMFVEEGDLAIEASKWLSEQN